MPSPKRAPLQVSTIPESEKQRAQQILQILRETLTISSHDFVSVLVYEESHDPFKVLTATILSQNCTDIAALQAYRDLDVQIGVNPKSLAKVGSRTIAKAIHFAGLHNQKARALRRLGLVLLNQPPRTLEAILTEPVDEARATLQGLPNVGPKTADVLLSVWKRPTISVDTHVDRVSRRLGFAARKAKYEDVRAALMQTFSETDYSSVPLLFMAHGRKFCKARRPLCPICPIGHLCPYRHKTTRTASQSASHVTIRR
jgi:endonuclease-3